jgi:hypothetical protein
MGHFGASFNSVKLFRYFNTTGTVKGTLSYQSKYVVGLTDSEQHSDSEMLNYYWMWLLEEPRGNTVKKFRIVVPIYVSLTSLYL